MIENKPSERKLRFPTPFTETVKAEPVMGIIYTTLDDALLDSNFRLDVEHGTNERGQLSPEFLEVKGDRQTGWLMQKIQNDPEIRAMFDLSAKPMDKLTDAEIKARTLRALYRATKK